MSRICSLVGYLLVIALAGQCAQFQTGMLKHETELIKWMAQAFMMQNETLVNNYMASNETYVAGADATQAHSLGLQANGFEVQAHKEQALASDDSHVAKSWYHDASEKKAAAEFSEGQASAAEKLVHQDKAKAKKATSFAARLKNAIHHSGFFTGMWHWVQGIFGIVSQSKAKAEIKNYKAEAVRDAAAAVAEQEVTKKNILRAAKMDRLAEADESTANSWGKKAETEHAVSEVHSKEVNQDLVLAVSLHAESQEEESVAASHNSLAETESLDAQTCKKAAKSNGYSALINAGLSALFASLALVFCGVKLLMRAMNFLVTRCCGIGPTRPLFVILRDMCYAAVHILLIPATAVSIANVNGLDDMPSDMVLDGVLVLVFGGFAATFQCILLHLMPWLARCDKGRHSNSPCLSHVNLSRNLLTGLFIMLFLAPLFTMEALILWIDLGSNVVGTAMATWFLHVPVWVFWTVVGVGVSIYIALTWTTGSAATGSSASTSTASSETVSMSGQVIEGEDVMVSEKAQLLRMEKSVVASHTTYPEPVEDPIVVMGEAQRVQDASTSIEEFKSIAPVTTYESIAPIAKCKSIASKATWTPEENPVEAVARQSIEAHSSAFNKAYASEVVEATMTVAVARGQLKSIISESISPDGAVEDPVEDMHGLQLGSIGSKTPYSAGDVKDPVAPRKIPRRSVASDTTYSQDGEDSTVATQVSRGLQLKSIAPLMMYAEGIEHPITAKEDVHGSLKKKLTSSAATTSHRADDTTVATERTLFLPKTVSSNSSYSFVGSEDLMDDVDLSKVGESTLQGSEGSDSDEFAVPPFQWHHLAIPLEILILSFCVVVLTCVMVHVRLLWPLLCRAMEESWWWIVGGAVAYVGLIMAVAFWSLMRR